MLLDHNRAKIVQPDTLIALLGTRPRESAVILCHGVFDVVHPGHLRHLLYAKSKAGILVASVTADRYINKGPHRPHVPQELRAANLSAYDFVDYVVICDEEKPLDLLRLLQPDFYAKGFEYSADARVGPPVEEASVVEAYGGELLYTPGDVVYSSTTLIEAAAPDLRWEKLALVMRRAELTFDALRATVRAMPGKTAHIVGDTIVDRLTYCDLVGAIAKTPTMSVRRERSEDFVGGAAIVAKHARAAGADVRFVTVLGDDAAGMLVLDELATVGVAVDHTVDRARPTTVKEAVVVGGYRLLKIDTVDNRSVSGPILRHLRDAVAVSAVGAVVFSDFRHGIFNASTIPALTAAIPSSCLRVADSQVASRWGNITEFRGFDLVTPNEREARFALGDQDSGVRPLAARLYEETACRWLFVKLGPRGLIAFGPQEGEVERSFVLDAHAGRVLDPVGAGDACLAYATLALLVHPCLATAAILGTFAAGAECEYDGNIPVAPERVLAKIDEAEREIG